MAELLRDSIDDIRRSLRKRREAAPKRVKATAATRQPAAQQKGTSAKVRARSATR
jgi:hypothetical protein